MNSYYDRLLLLQEIDAYLSKEANTLIGWVHTQLAKLNKQINNTIKLNIALAEIDIGNNPLLQGLLNNYQYKEGKGKSSLLIASIDYYLNVQLL